MFHLGLMFHGILVGLSLFSCSTIASGNRVIHRELSDYAVCPLDFNKLHQVVFKNPSQLQFPDVQSQCQYLLKAIRIIRADYLRKTANFTFPPDAADSCWNIFEFIVKQYIPAFDVRSSCGVQTRWISNSCMNISTKSEFEALIPEPQLQGVTRWCNRSLDGNSSCDQCVSTLSNIERDYFGGSEVGNVSDCSGFPSIYAAAFDNQFGLTKLGTSKCLFSIDSTFGPRRTNKKNVLRGVLIGCFTGFLVLIIVVLFLWRKKKEHWQRKDHPGKVKPTTTTYFESLGKSTTVIRFDIEELKEATRTFSRDNLIGTGGYGNVYKGLLADGSEVALKRFKNCSVAGDENFTHEVEVIASVRHVNIVALRGYCTATIPPEGHQRIIVCDFVQNGSLHDHLFGSGAKRLSWPIRRKIALGIARGLAYLHNGVIPAIIHRDIKASNILLDESFEAKLADFGLAKFTPDGCSHFSTKVAGTLGYVSPEYALYGQLTERSDVFSFGVVLLELLSGRKAFTTDSNDSSLLLTDWAWSLVREGQSLDVIEDNMPEIGPSETMEKYVLLAILCVHPSLYARPTMDWIVKILETDMGIVDSTPNPPCPTVAEINDVQTSVPFTCLSVVLNSVDQYPHETDHSILEHRKREETSQDIYVDSSSQMKV